MMPMGGQAGAGSMADEISRLIPQYIQHFVAGGRMSPQEGNMLLQECSMRLNEIVSTLRQKYGGGGVTIDQIGVDINAILWNMLTMLRQSMANQSPGMFGGGQMMGGGGMMPMAGGFGMRPGGFQAGFSAPQMNMSPGFGGGMRLATPTGAPANPGTMYSTGEQPVLREQPPTHRPAMLSPIPSPLSRAAPPVAAAPVSIEPQPKGIAMKAPEEKTNEAFTVSASDSDTTSRIFVFENGMEKVLHNIVLKRDVVLGKYNLIDFVADMHDVDTSADMVAVQHMKYVTCECASSSFETLFKSLKEKIGPRREGDYGGVQALMRHITQLPMAMSEFLKTQVLAEINRHFDLGAASNNRYKGLCGTVESLNDVLMLAGLIKITDPKVINDLRPWTDNPDWAKAFDVICNQSIRNFIESMVVVNPNGAMGREIVSQHMKMELTDDNFRMMHYHRFDVQASKKTGATPEENARIAEADKAVQQLRSAMNDVTVIGYPRLTVVTPIAPFGTVAMTRQGLETGMFETPVTEFDHMLVQALANKPFLTFDIVFLTAPSVVFMGQGGINMDGGVTIKPLA
jgi:hypothetical protein